MTIKTVINESVSAGLSRIYNDKQASNDCTVAAYSVAYGQKTSSIVDNMTVKVLALQHNRWECSSRFVDMCVFIGSK